MNNGFEISTWNEYLELEEWHEGWPGAGYDSASTEIKMRRVVNSDRGDEVQISVKIVEHKGNRMYTHIGSMEIPAEHIQKVIDALNGELNKAPA